MAATTVDDMTAARGAPVPAQSIQPRRSLPSGRAVIGALLVTLAGVGAFAVANRGDSAPETSYLVAARSITTGAQINPDDVSVVAIDLPAPVAATSVASSSPIEGATVLRDLRAGELIPAGDLLPAAAAGQDVVTDRHELTIPVPRDRAGRSLGAGDRVTVLATLNTDGPVITFVAVEDALVIDWATGGDAIGASTDGALTLALAEPDEVMALAHMAREGDLTVVRTTRAIGATYPREYPVDRIAANRPAREATEAES